MTTAAVHAPWATEADFVGKAALLYAEDPTLFERSIEQASAILDRLAGHQVGTAEITETLCPILLCDPCKHLTDPVLGHTMDFDHPGPNLRSASMIDHYWYDMLCGGCKKSCRGRGPEWAPLTYGPVCQVLAVELDGEDMVEGEDFVMSEHYMVRIDGMCWPSVSSLCCSDPCGGSGHPVDWTVRYRYGTEPDTTARIAAAALATELALHYMDKPCKLPERVISYNQGGMDFRLIDRMDFLDKGRTGIYQVDLFLESINPDDYRGSAPRVTSAEGMAKVGGAKLGSGWT